MNAGKKIVMPISCVVLGIIIGLNSGLLSFFLDTVEHVFLGFVETSTEPAAYGTWPIRRFLSVTIGGLAATLIWWILRNRCPKIPTVSDSLSGEKMPFWPTIIHVATQILYVGTGGSVGREAAPRDAGALFAQQWEKLLNRWSFTAFSEKDKQLLIAAAAGAGFAGIYIAPLTGMAFCVEILVKKINTRTVSVSLSMSVIAMVIGGAFKGTKPYYAIGSDGVSMALFVFVLILAPLCGIIGSYFRIAFKWAETSQTTGKHILWQLPLMALITGLISLIFPQIMGNGRAMAQTAINASGLSIIPMLFIGAMLKGVVTVLTIRSGASGGTLTPAIAIGACIGTISGILISTFFPDFFPDGNIWQCAILGACSFLAAAQRAPLMALFMLFEVCHLPIGFIAPLGLAVAISGSIAQLIVGKTEGPVKIDD